MTSPRLLNQLLKEIIMGKVSDYISSLDGKDNIDPLVIASTVLELHNEEMDTANNKIASLEQNNVEWESKYTEQSNLLRDAKAKNWDLINRVPASDADDNARRADENNAASEVTMDDFFKKED